jgi:hypothetical protein
MTYQDWQQRVCPIGIPEEDRLRAEEEIKQHLNETFTATASIPGRKLDRAWRYGIERGSRLYKTLMPNGTSTAIDLEGKVSWS